MRSIIPIFLLASGALAASPVVFTPQERSALLEEQTLAVCYSGFRRGQHPDRGQGPKNPSREEILEDLKILSQQAGFRLLRVYDSKENSRRVLEIIREERLPLKVLLGAWLGPEVSTHGSCAWVGEPMPEKMLAENRVANDEEVGRAIALAREFPDVVVAVNIGNETLVDWNDHRVSVERLKEMLKRAGEALDQPVTTADNYAAWARYGADLAGVVDFAGVHTYPIWEKQTLAGAMAFTIDNLSAVQRAVPGVPLAITEAGWATTASEFPEQAGEDQQEVHMRDLCAWARTNNVTVFWFEAFDEDWKGDPADPLGAEKHWGIFNIDREPKKAARQPVALLLESLDAPPKDR